MPLQKVNPTARRQFVNQTRTRALSVDTGGGTQRASILNELGKFAQAGSTEANRQQKAEIETKKALGSSRAAQDLLKAEENRQGVSEDDVLATKLSYNAIVGKHDTMNAGNEFAEWYSANPDSDDDAIDEKKSELYQPLFEKYGSDDKSLKQFSLQVQESQFNLLGVQEGIKGAHQKAKSKEALGISINDLLATPNADIESIMDTELPARAKALGLNEWELKSTVVNQAASNAAEGDERMLKKLESEDWAKDSAAVKKARSEYTKFIAREQTPAIGNAMGDIEIENVSLNVPWETTLNKIEGLNEQFPSTYSSARVSALKQARARAVIAAENATSGTTDSFAIFTDSTRLPFAQDPKYTTKDRAAVIKELEGRWASKYKEMTEQGGVDEVEARNTIFQEQLKWSRLNQTKLPVLSTALDASLNLPLDDIAEGKELPNYVTDTFDMFKKMDATAIELYMPSGKDKAFALNFNKFAGTMTDDAAYRRADTIKRNPFKVSPEQRTEQRDKTRTVVDDALNVGFWEGLNPFSDKVQVPEWQQEQIINRLTDNAEQTMYAGGFDAQANAEQALSIFQSTSTQNFNGTILNKPITTIHSQISKGRPMPIAKTNEYIESFMLNQKDNIDASYGIPVDMADIAMEMSRDGSAFVLKDKNGEQIQGRFLTEDIYAVGRDANLEELRAQNVSEVSQVERANEIREEEELMKQVEDDLAAGKVPFHPFL